MTEPDPWRYRCPEGHTTWTSTQSGMKQAKAPFYCISCQRKDGVSPHFEKLTDAKTGKRVSGVQA